MIMLSYDPDGNLLWDVNFDGPATNNDEAHGIVVSPYGNNIYLLGYARGFITSNADLTVVKYSQVTPVAEQNNLDVALYPNPCSDSFVLEGNWTGTGTLTMVDIAGNRVLEVVVSGNRFEVATERLAEGMYQIILKFGNAFFTKPIVIAGR